MILKETSLFASIRGSSTATKKSNLFGLRTIEPKFMRGYLDRPSSIKKNEHYQSTIKVLKKENVPPARIEIVQKSPSVKKETPNEVVKQAPKQPKVATIAEIDVYPTGLHNIGNTCYMNATLQCLFHSKCFNKIIVNEIDVISRHNTHSMPVASECALAVKAMSKSASGALNLGALKKGLGRKKPIFLGNSQQDAQEYLSNLLQILNEELSRIKTKNKYRQLEGDPSKKSIRLLSDQWWGYYREIDNSIICDIFQGQMISTIKCKKCSKVSVNFDNMWGMPVSFHRNSTVMELIAGTWKVQSAVDDFYCSGCKQLRNCSKAVEMFRLPKILVIQLKRFVFEKGLKRKRKEDVKIDRHIDLVKLLHPEASQAQQTKYKLRGVVHHNGQAEYGHYYAEVYVQSLKRWYLLNDSNTEETVFSEQSKSAYLLVYEMEG